MTTQAHLPIFVYGTLKRGEVRERMWPRGAVSIEEATARGRLYDLGTYPALVDGDDVIRGELWHVSAEDFQMTLDVLDAIECYGNDEVDLYVRRIIECRTLGGEPRRAYTYFFANPNELDGVPVVSPDADGFCRWSRC
jgi:gamma-glutamylcyclotransferase (GGCT)/AIG2-like uncharacterized protein YtfP